MSATQPIDEQNSSHTPSFKGIDAGRSRVLTLVFTDLVGSVALKGKLGDAAAALLMARHFSHVRSLAFETGGREIAALGDGFLLAFEAPSAAVEFALYLQHTHHQQADLPSVRIGLHLGEVTERSVTPGGGSQSGLELEGLAVDVCSRIQSLALPGQILLSYAVFDSARQRLRADQLNLPLAWRAHGRFAFKGYDQVLEIFEAGIEGISPLVPPQDSEKARRDVRGEDEAVLGWRPAQGLEMPSRPNWVLTEKLGEGGFGDVWLIMHSKTREYRVIKFCYSRDRVRALQREVTLFRLLRETLGERNDIARVMDYQFDQPPYFLEMDYAGQADLKAWLERKDWGGSAPLETRLDIIAQVAEAIGAAHSVGVLHKDIKPSNILVSELPQHKWQARVIDFGIGGISSREVLEERGITAMGMTEIGGQVSPNTLSGTRLYMAPELIEGKPATTQSDIYSLGVVLYQVVTGRPEHALAPGWERDIEDPLLRADIAACVDGDPTERFGSARELAEHLRKLPERREQLRREQEQAERELRRRRRRPLLWIAAGAAVLLTIFGVLFAWQLSIRLRSEAVLRAQAVAATRDALRQATAANAAQKYAERAQYFSTIQTAASSIRENRIEKARELLLKETPEELRQLEWGLLYAQTSQEVYSIRAANIFDAVYSPDGSIFATGDRDNQTSGAGWVTIYDARTGKRLRGAQVHKQLVWDLRFSPDGKRLATASSDRSAAVVDVESLNVLSRMEGHQGVVRSAAFTPDGSSVVTIARDETIRFWDAATGKQTRIIKVPGEAPADLQVSPTGSSIVVTTVSGRVMQWGMGNDIPIAEYPGHGDSVLSATFGPGGTTLVTACKDGLLRVFPYLDDGSTSGSAPLRAATTIGSWPSAVAYSPASYSLYVACDNGQCRVYDFDPLKLRLDFRTDEPAWKIEVSPDAKRVLVTSRWSARCFDLNLLAHNAEYSPYRGDPLTSDVRRVRATSIVPERDTTWNLDREWRTTAGRTLVKVQDLNVAVDSFFSVFSPDNKQCIRINDQTLSATVLEVPSARVLAELSPERVCDAVYSPDGKRAAVAGMQAVAQIWDATSWTLLHTLDRKAEYCSTIEFSPDGKSVVVGYTDGIIIVWDAETGSQSLITGGQGHRALSLAFSADSTLMVSGHSNDRAMVWDLETGKEVSRLVGHVRYVYAVAFSPDGARILTCARDGTSKLWDTQTGKELATVFEMTNNVQVLNAFFLPESNHLGAITSDHRFLLTDYFPWQPAQYPEPSLSLAQRVELWKRRQRIDPNITPADIMTR